MSVTSILFNIRAFGASAEGQVSQFHQGNVDNKKPASLLAGFLLSNGDSHTFGMTISTMARP